MRTIKLVIIGDSGVGKTSLRSNYISGRFPTGYRATIGTDFITKTLPHYSIPDEFVTLQIWDTAGQERFSSLSTAFFRGADAVLMVYDVTSPQTLQNLRKWWHEFQVRAPVPDEEALDYCCVVIGNKIDLAADLGHGQRKMSVSEQVARSFLEELIPPSSSDDASITSPSTIRPFPLALQPENHLSPPGITFPQAEDEDNTVAQQKPVDIRFSSRGLSLSRATSRSRFGGTMTTTHTGMSVYYTPASSVFDEYVSPPSSPLDSPARGTHRRRLTSMSSSSDTVTPSLFASPSPSSAMPVASPPLDRGPKLFFASAKSGESVPAIFEYIAKRVVVRWEWEESVRERMLEYTERHSEIQTVRLNTENASSWSKTCCS